MELLKSDAKDALMSLRFVRNLCHIAPSFAYMYSISYMHRLRVVEPLFICMKKLNVTCYLNKVRKQNT